MQIWPRGKVLVQFPLPIAFGSKAEALQCGPQYPETRRPDWQKDALHEKPACALLRQVVPDARLSEQSPMLAAFGSRADASQPGKGLGDADGRVVGDADGPGVDSDHAMVKSPEAMPSK